MDATTAKQYLTEAETALHALMTGGGVQMISGPNGSMVRFEPRNIDQLQKYIAWLQRYVTPRRPLLFEFPR